MLAALKKQPRQPLARMRPSLIPNRRERGHPEVEPCVALLLAAHEQGHGQKVHHPGAVAAVTHQIDGQFATLRTFEQVGEGKDAVRFGSLLDHRAREAHKVVAVEEADRELAFGQSLGPQPVVRDLLEFVQLSDRGKDLVEPLSGGMKRRLTIARSLINEPDLMLLDEPTTGLDPQARHLLWDRLYRLKQRGVTLVLTTHYMDEAEQLCDRLVVMDKAKIVAEGSPRELIAKYSTREVTELRFAPGVQETLDGQLDGLAERIERLPDRVLLYADDGEAAVAAAHARGLQPEQVLVRRSSLEDVFLRLTGRSLIE